MYEAHLNFKVNNVALTWSCLSLLICIRQTRGDPGSRSWVRSSSLLSNFSCSLADLLKLTFLKNKLLQFHESLCAGSGLALCSPGSSEGHGSSAAGAEFPRPLWDLLVNNWEAFFKKAGKSQNPTNHIYLSYKKGSHLLSVPWESQLLTVYAVRPADSGRGHRIAVEAGGIPTV